MEPGNGTGSRTACDAGVVRRVALLLVVLAVLPGVARADSPPRGVLEASQRFDFSGGVYTEGSLSYLRVRRHGRVIRQRSRAGAVGLRLRLRPGLYRVSSFQRPCQGNCDVLDPPRERCSRRLRIWAGETSSARVVTRPFRGCRMWVREAPAFPSRARIRAARRYVRGRALSSFAVIDSHGRLHGFAPRRRYISASVVKAMLLVAYLRQIGNRLPDAGERATLGPMITLSDNGRASAIHARVGDAGLLALARRAGMRDLTVAGHWGSVFFSAADQARFFWRLPSLVPPRSRPYARRLLSSIVPAQRWGFSRFSLRAGWRTFFKGGWRQTGLGSLVHEAARFERGRGRFSLAVLSGREPLSRLRHRHAARRGSAAVRALPGGPCRARGGLSRAPPRRPEGRAALRSGDRDRAGLPLTPQHHRPAAARLLPRLGAAARARRSRPGSRAAPPAPARPRAADPRRLPAGARIARARALGAAQRPRRAGGHLHRRAQPPQHRLGGRPDAGAGLRRAPAAHGHRLRRARPRGPHAQRERAASCAIG